eukprot:SAG31_NODE_19751_length_592_cov_1.245436_2_plen_81_part_00
MHTCTCVALFDARAAAWVRDCRSGVTMDSDKRGTLNPGDVLTVLEARRLNGKIRIRFEKGWVSEIASNGEIDIFDSCNGN